MLRGEFRWWTRLAWILPLPACGERVGVRGPRRVRGANVTKTLLARRLRKHSTVAERKLWQYLRSRSLAGFKFVRQEPIGPYIVDFACREKRLVIEIDGGQHADNRGDAARDRWLWSIATACSASGTMKCWKISKASGIRSSRLRMRQRPLTPTLSPHAGRGSRQAGPRNQTGLRIQAGPQNDSRPAE